MRITVDTNGIGASTKIFINGEEQPMLTYFSITVRRFGKVKCQMIREKKVNEELKEEFVSYYGGDFEKNDELYGKKKN